MQIESVRFQHGFRDPRGYVTPLIWSQRRPGNENLSNILFTDTNSALSEAKRNFFDNEVKSVLSGLPINNGVKFMESRSVSLFCKL